MSSFIRDTEFLVVGSGIAGLSFALKAAAIGKVIVVTKANEDESNTKYAQGGVAAVIDASDSFEKHIHDTLVAGDGLCDKEVVSLVVEEGPKRIQEIIGYGTQFDKVATGDFDLAKEGGHSAHRVLHYKDITGFEIERTLLEQVHRNKNIEVLTHFFSMDIITQHHLGIGVTKGTPDITCYGMYVLNTRTMEVEKIRAKITLMATGGSGQIYAATTNPTIATGDGVAMVYRAKGKVRNMEFIQFHPTALYNPGETPSFLISEAVRGAGGVLKNQKGESFMGAYDLRKDLAPRDIVARAIDAEMKKSGEDFVYLDIRHVQKKIILDHFPNIYAKCLSIGIDMSKDMIPVLPAAHYMCGGIMVDIYGRSSIKNLFSCGESSSTGLHGANRLASNSLLEALVFAERSFAQAKAQVGYITFQDNIPDWNEQGTTQLNEDVLVSHNIKEVQRIMSDYVGIVRSNFRLERALRRIGLLMEETESFYKETRVSVRLCELRNLLQVAFLVVKSAMLRKESRGLHYTTDYPGHNDHEIKDTVF